MRRERHEPDVGPVRPRLRGRRLAGGARPAAAGRGRRSTPTCRGSDPTPPPSAPAALAAALRGSEAPLKARLLDQSRVAGVGNLIADEVLWRAGLSPLRPAGSLSPAEVRRLHRHLRRTLDDLIERGGSHLGDLMEERHPGGRCPRDGTELVRSTVGGRTSLVVPGTTSGDGPTGPAARPVVSRQLGQHLGGVAVGLHVVPGPGDLPVGGRSGRSTG